MVQVSPQVPDQGCTPGSNKCSRTGGHTAWFTNYTAVTEVSHNYQFMYGIII